MIADKPKFFNETFTYPPLKLKQFSSLFSFIFLKIFLNRLEKSWKTAHSLPFFAYLSEINAFVPKFVFSLLLYIQRYSEITKNN